MRLPAPSMPCGLSLMKSPFFASVWMYTPPQSENSLEGPAGYARFSGSNVPVEATMKHIHPVIEDAEAGPALAQRDGQAK
jgi:hypothetical protein